MKDNPLVSVIMPAYNAEKYIAEAIESVINQTYTNWELIVINDCSTDSTQQIIEQYEQKDKRIHLLNNETNSGVAITRNNGIKLAKGECIALLDSDDVWLPQKLTEQLKLIKEGYDIIYSSYDFIDENSNSLNKGFKVKETTNYNQMLKRNEIGCSTALLKSSLFDNNKFNTEFYHEDYLLWIQLLKQGYTAKGTTQTLVHYRKIKGSRSDNKINAAKKRWLIYRRYLNFGFLKSFENFLVYAFNGLLKHL